MHSAVLIARDDVNWVLHTHAGRVHNAQWKGWNPMMPTDLLMLKNWLLWIYLANAIVLILHAMDSAYWRELDLLDLPVSITGFLMRRVPLLFVAAHGLLLHGLLLLERGELAGLIVSMLVGVAGLTAFGIRSYLLIKHRAPFSKPISSFSIETYADFLERRKFRTPISQFILWSALFFSIAQIILTVIWLVRA